MVDICREEINKRKKCAEKEIEIKFVDVLLILDKGSGAITPQRFHSEKFIFIVTNGRGGYG